MTTTYDPKDLVGIAEVAEMAKISRQAVLNWTARNIDFPLPVLRLRATPVFSRKAVQAWLEKTGRVATPDRPLVGTHRQGSKPLAIEAGSKIRLSVWNGNAFREVIGTVEGIEPSSDGDEIIYLSEDSDMAYFVSQVVEINGKPVTE